MTKTMTEVLGTDAEREKRPFIGGFGLAHGADWEWEGAYPLAALTVRLNETVRMTMTIENNTGAAVTRALLAAYGRYDAATATFTAYFLSARDGVSIGTGITRHDVDCRTTTIGIGLAALAAVGTIAAGRFTIETHVLKINQLTVTGVAVKDFALGKV